MGNRRKRTVLEAARIANLPLQVIDEVAMLRIRSHYTEHNDSAWLTFYAWLVEFRGENPDRLHNRVRMGKTTMDMFLAEERALVTATRWMADTACGRGAVVKKVGDARRGRKLTPKEIRETVEHRNLIGGPQGCDTMGAHLTGEGFYVEPYEE